MPKPHSQQISLLDTPCYHICSRSVIKAHLCGVDNDTGVVLSKDLQVLPPTPKQSSFTSI
ncbi:hypothetical protein [Colwellia sp. 12G3]|uniref:hypothetical protein n=1 Tax=Colwellia sp. 12G3 TaxID=2058299 RepID=UPI001E4926B8|nr:hypothetical protein [Colwellia sp. 12G3]